MAAVDMCRSWAVCILSSGMRFSLVQNAQVDSPVEIFGRKLISVNCQRLAKARRVTATDTSYYLYLLILMALTEKLVYPEYSVY